MQSPNYINIAIRALDEELPIPQRGRESDAGYDLCARVDHVLQPGEQYGMPTGIAISLPSGVAGLVLPRSGLARDYGLSIRNTPGLIDPGYTGEIIVLLHLGGDQPLSITRGDRIAQLLFVPFLSANWNIVDAHTATERGGDGFGSSGIS